MTPNPYAHDRRPSTLLDACSAPGCIACAYARHARRPTLALALERIRREHAARAYSGPAPNLARGRLRSNDHRALIRAIADKTRARSGAPAAGPLPAKREEQGE